MVSIAACFANGSSPKIAAKSLEEYPFTIFELSRRLNRPICVAFFFSPFSRTATTPSSALFLSAPLSSILSFRLRFFSCNLFFSFFLSLFFAFPSSPLPSFFPRPNDRSSTSTPPSSSSLPLPSACLDVISLRDDRTLWNSLIPFDQLLVRLCDSTAPTPHISNFFFTRICSLSPCLLAPRPSPSDHPIDLSNLKPEEAF
mmetsp:Transcript_14738/g.42062  ORF Transcript_14738/g.42062 Transcript_14738/m.42062 type:complete len:200 (-) Transcript_14738:2312-2911(-)